LLVVASACYKSVPLETSTPPVGQTVSFIISDQGRVGLGDRMGPGITRIEGRMLGTEGDQYVVSVFRTAALGGSTSVWSGEEMRLDRNFVSRLEGRELSKSRTWLAAGAATSVVVAFIVTCSTGTITIPRNPTRDRPRECDPIFVLDGTPTAGAPLHWRLLNEIELDHGIRCERRARRRVQGRPEVGRRA
jgi:hypothetical protein